MATGRLLRSAAPEMESPRSAESQETEFICILRDQQVTTSPSSLDNVCLSRSYFEEAKLYWIKESQTQLQVDDKFLLWKHQLGLFQDKFGIWKSRRMSNCNLTSDTQLLIFVDKKHYLATLLVLDAHKRVIHNGVKEMLAEYSGPLIR